MLNNIIPDPLVYIFYISIFSMLVVFAIPFTHTPTLEVFILASFSTILWTLGAYFMFKALKIGNVSRVIPVIGTLIPLILLILASSSHTITTPQIWAVLLLIGGMIFLTIPGYKGSLSKREIVFEILSAVFFAFSYVVLRETYASLDFFSVLVWSRLILMPLGIIIFLIPSLRRKIITPHGLKINFRSKLGLLFLGGQASGAFSELLILFSISLANPALVNSLQGSQYVFLLIFAIILSKKYPAIFGEKYTLLNIVSRICGIVVLSFGLYLLAFA